MADLAPGDILWVTLDPAVGREQAGRRPAVVVSGHTYLQLVDTLATVVPLTSRDRGWDNHVLVRSAGLNADSFAMTEQVRTVSRERILGLAGHADPHTLAEIREWVVGFIDED